MGLSWRLVPQTLLTNHSNFDASDKGYIGTGICLISYWGVEHHRVTSQLIYISFYGWVGGLIIFCSQLRPGIGLSAILAYKL